MIGKVFYFDWEIQFMQWLQSFESGFTTSLASFFTMLGEDLLLVGIIGLCFWCFDKELGRRLGLSIIGGMIFGTLIKGVVLRRRPYMDNKAIKCIRPAEPDADIMNPLQQGFSFPSLHASMSAAAYGSLHYNIRKNWTLALAFVLPLLIGLSRNYLGVHYPTDVIAGWLLGLIAIFLLGAFDRKYGFKKGYALVLIIGAAGFFYCNNTEFYTAYGVNLGFLIGLSFEEKYVKFEMPTRWWSYFVRPVMGVVCFFLVSTLLKLPVSNVPLAKDHILMLIYRLFRYTISVFTITALYPMLFKRRS